MATRSIINLFVNTDKRLTFTFDPVPSGGISGWTMKWAMSDELGGDDLILKTGTVSNATTGVFYFDLAVADWAGISAGGYYWECYRDDSGLKDVVAYGRLVARERV